MTLRFAVAFLAFLEDLSPFFFAICLLDDAAAYMPSKGGRAKPFWSSLTNPQPIYILLSNVSHLHASVMPQTKAIVSIENVVASASINQRVDLNLITKNFVDVEYHPDKFPGLVFRLKVPKTATLVFSSGKMVCTVRNRRSWQERP